MKYFNRYVNNTGLTLIELLASITLLSIVIIIFLSIFSQSMIWSSKVEDRLTAVNLAERVLYEARTDSVPTQPITLNGKNYYFEIDYPVSDVIDLEESLGLTRIHVKICDELPCSKVESEIYGYIEQED
ncbi:type II secretion system protein [Alkalihalophilus lindianensis]|uniref:Type II secretion system protein n=1 Tax=Alkalihalophilus lindianensis TaxID=1630542 RepID=A0ABU3X8K5_9BACI|nr:type II secretion system protein [Alkalihalophilus lindianensis]MDV2684221.1 type II secretion system protein [Alkalihalophilus lindianensis]